MIDLDILSKRVPAFKMTTEMPELKLSGYSLCKEEKPKKSQMKKMLEEHEELQEAIELGNVIEIHKEYRDYLQTVLNGIQMLPIPKTEATNPSIFMKRMDDLHNEKMRLRSNGGDALIGKDRNIEISGEFTIIRK